MSALVLEVVEDRDVVPVRALALVVVHQASPPGENAMEGSLVVAVVDCEFHLKKIKKNKNETQTNKKNKTKNKFKKTKENKAYKGQSIQVNENNKKKRDHIIRN